MLGGSGFECFMCIWKANLWIRNKSENCEGAKLKMYSFCASFSITLCNDNMVLAFYSKQESFTYYQYLGTLYEVLITHVCKTTSHKIYEKCMKRVEGQSVQWVLHVLSMSIHQCKICKMFLCDFPKLYGLTASTTIEISCLLITTELSRIMCYRGVNAIHELFGKTWIDEPQISFLQLVFKWQDMLMQMKQASQSSYLLYTPFYSQEGNSRGDYIIVM